jgi:hypothetical protein
LIPVKRKINRAKNATKNCEDGGWKAHDVAKYVTPLDPPSSCSSVALLASWVVQFFVPASYTSLESGIKRSARLDAHDTPLNRDAGGTPIYQRRFLADALFSLLVRTIR